VSRVFIVLATWEPSEALLDRQIDSLSRQALTDWSGVVVDDGSAESTQHRIAARLAHEPRLRFEPRTDRLGFFRNFERGLAMAPADADYVALCDQDDHWAAQKLEQQVKRLDERPEAQLCYTDLRLVDASGVPLLDSFWRLRPHGDRFREVLYNNVVTGSTAVFRRRLLNAALPFPDDPGGAFHDHWLALCAMASGGLTYIDEPLVSYTQHRDNALGAQALEHVGRGALLRFLRSAWVHPRVLAGRLAELRTYATAADARLCSFAAALHARFPGLSGEMASALRPFLRSNPLARALDLGGATLFGSAMRGEQTDLAPLKIALGMSWKGPR